MDSEFDGEAEVAIRPWDIRIGPCREGRANARVLQSIFMGDFYKAELALDGQTFMIATFPGSWARFWKQEARYGLK
jgi:ABC-type Fe3+/spermidine/putrescine transport system ATPase subunit